MDYIFHYRIVVVKTRVVSEALCLLIDLYTSKLLLHRVLENIDHIFQHSVLFYVG